MSCLELCIVLGNYCKLLCLTCNFVFKCKGIRDAPFLLHFRIGQIYLILRTTHIHALLHVLSWLHHWLSPLITYFAPPNTQPGYGPDYAVKMLSIHERYRCGVPVIIEGETGVGKTALIQMLSVLWNHSLLDSWNKEKIHIHDFIKSRIVELPENSFDGYGVRIKRVW